MVDNSPLNRPSAQGPIRNTGGVQPSGTPASAPKTRETGPAFHVLLEKLQQQAQSLHEEAEAVDKPEDLSSAVDRARVSLNDALSLSDQLLEAYRETLHRDGSNDDGGSS